MMATGYRGWEIKKKLRDEYGYRKSGHQRIFTAAKAHLQMLSGKSKEDHKLSALHVYQEIVRKTLDDDLRIKAQMRIDKILGLEEPQLVHQTVKGTQPITVKYVGDEWRTALPPTRFEVVATNGNGHGDNDPGY